jgi:hypothetical protein
MPAVAKNFCLGEAHLCGILFGILFCRRAAGRNSLAMEAAPRGRCRFLLAATVALGSTIGSQLKIYKAAKHLARIDRVLRRS